MDTKQKWLHVLVALVLAVSLALAGCGGDGDGDDDGGGEGDVTAPTVMADPVGGTYFATQSVTLTAEDDTDPDPAIHYTTDGSDPDTGSATFSAAIEVAADTTLKFFAVDDAGNASAIVTEEYVISEDAEAPTVAADPAGGSFSEFSFPDVVLTAEDDADPSPVVHYTRDGSDPTTESPVASGPVPIYETTTLKFLAVDAAGNASDIVTEEYTVTLGGIGMQWASSGHADAEGEAFRHWDEDGEIPTSCAKCHSRFGYLDFAVDDTVDEAAPLGSLVDCNACHSTGFVTLWGAEDGEGTPAFPALEPVTFPSGETASVFGPSNLCIACHQGRESKDSVDETIAANPEGPFTFINIHYYPAAATYFGTEVRGGYEYDGMTYRARNTFPSHPDSLKDCAGCHLRGDETDHTFVPMVEDCNGCHGGDSFETLGGTPGTNFADLEELSEVLFAEIQSYATDVIGTDIAYDSGAYPYFFVDTNGNGLADEDEANFGNRYDVFDAALLKAAYNYQMDQKDPCDYLHNGTYSKQLLYDSIMDLGGTPPDVIVPGRTSVADLAAPEQQTAEWQQSGHADAAGEAFRHWDEDGEVEADCAKCHSTPGFQDYLEDGTVDAAAPLGTVVNCTACHANADLYSDASTWFDVAEDGDPILAVEFPSGETATLFNASNLCLACHQGRESKDSVDETIAEDDDGVFTFINIHYYPAAATYFGSEVRGGYEYDGMEYRGRNTFPSHPDTLKDCVGCHLRGDDTDHLFVPEVEDCNVCHGGDSFETLGGTPGENFADLEALSEALLAEIQSYATTVIGTDIAYDSGAYPYFFVDTNGNGVADEGEANFGNRFSAFDATLLKAAYNYQMDQKDPCDYIHNGTYSKQLLYDSIVDLGGTPPDVVVPGRTSLDDLEGAAKQTAQWQLSGHADAAGEPFRHWDEDGEVSADCAKCHSAPGFLDFIQDGTVDAAAPLGTVVNCTACHSNTNLYAEDDTWYEEGGLAALTDVEFPSGATADLGDNSNLCMACHQGRESGLSIAGAEFNEDGDGVDDYDFINRHYFAAAAILFGSDVTAGFEYDGKTYKGQNTFAAAHGSLDTCVECHLRGEEDHEFVPQVSDCSTCHTGIASFEDLGLPFGAANVDYDGDGTGESFQGEIDGMEAALLAAMQDYAANTVGTPIIYQAGAYPYFFVDTDGNGAVDEGEANFGNRYRDFDLKLLQAAYNYHSNQDPCGDIHNYQYVLQTAYDATEDLGGDVSAMTRP